MNTMIVKKTMNQNLLKPKTQSFAGSSGTQNGVGLLEVLVSIMLLGISVLGFVALQARSVSATAESIVRSNSLNVMRDLADRIRLNPTALTTYNTELTQFNTDFNAGTSVTQPTTHCGLFGTTQNACNATQQATIDAFDIAMVAQNMGMQINLATCPGAASMTDIGGLCSIVSWNDTNPIIAAAATNGCMTTDGSYITDSSCILMEIF